MITNRFSLYYLKVACDRGKSLFYMTVHCVAEYLVSLTLAFMCVCVEPTVPGTTKMSPQIFKMSPFRTSALESGTEVKN